MFGNWAGFDLITRSCVTRELAGELSTLQVASQSFPQVFLVVLPQTAPGNVVPSSHICGWCSHCAFKSHSELKTRFSSQDLSERVTFPGLPQKPFHPTLYLRAPYMLTEESRAEGPQSSFTVPKGSACICYGGCHLDFMVRQGKGFCPRRIWSPQPPLAQITSDRGKDVLFICKQRFLFPTTSK